MGNDLAILMKVVDQATGPLQGIAGAVKGLGDAAAHPTQTLGKMTDVLGKIGLAGLGVKTLAEGVAGLAQSMVGGNAEFERYETQFGVLLGSSEEAKKRLAELAEFGAKTPFELPEVVRADKVLTSFGLDAKDTFDRFKVSAAQIRTTIGDVASGTGANFEELAVTFGKFASGATGEAIARFQELGIATREQMSSWGLQFSKSGELLTPAREAFTVLESHLRTKFGGMMNAQSTTFEGMVSNMQDWIGQSQRLVMAPVFEVLKDKLAGLLEFLNSDEAKAGLTSFANGVAGIVQGAIDFGSKAGPVIASVTPTLQSLWKVLTDLASGNVRAALNTFFIDVAGKFGIFGEPVDRAKEAIESFYNIVRPLIEQLGSVIKLVIDGDFRAAFQSLLNIMTSTWPEIRSQLLTWAAEFLNWILPMLPPLMEQLLQLATALLDWIVAQVPPMAEKLGQWVMEMWAWVQKVVPPLMETLGVLFLQLLDWVAANAPPLATKLIGEWIPAFIGWVAKAAIDIMPKLVEFLQAVVKWIIEVGVPKIIETALKLGEGIVKGMRQGLRNVSIPLPEIKVGTREGPMGIQIPTLDIGVMWKSLGELIPQLAKGGVIDRPTLAMIGEQPGNTEIVSPEKLLRQIIREEGGGGRGFNIDQLIIQSPEPLSPSSYRRQTEGMLRTLAAEYGVV